MVLERLIQIIDTHTMGEPTRIVTGGLPRIKGKTMLEKRNYFEQNLDYIRTMVLREPRGHNDMFGAVLTEPERDDSDFGVIFMSTGKYPQAYPYMCGHGTIGLMHMLVELNMVTVTEPSTSITLDTPDGPVTGIVHMKNGEPEAVEFDSVPAFLYKSDVELNIPGIGPIRVDISFNGGFFVMVSARDVGLAICPKNATKLANMGLLIRDVANETITIDYPAKPHFKTVDVIEFSEAPDDKSLPHKNVVVFGAGEVDRSPCGTGTSAKLATLFGKGELAVGQKFVHESITGTRFTGMVKKVIEKDGFTQVINTISGAANITGFNQLVACKGDVFDKGFLLE